MTRVETLCDLIRENPGISTGELAHSIFGLSSTWSRCRINNIRREARRLHGRSIYVYGRDHGTGGRNYPTPQQPPQMPEGVIAQLQAHRKRRAEAIKKAVERW